MTAVQSEGLIVVQDETLDEAKAAMDNALQNEKDARGRLELVMRRYERVDRSLTYARRMMTEALDRKTEADHRLDSTRRSAAHFRGGTKGEDRWQAESRRWGGQAQTLERDVRRWEAEARKNEEEARRAGMDDPRQHGIFMRAADSAKRKEQQARTRKVEIDRRAEEARRKGEDVRWESKERNREIGGNSKLGVAVERRVPGGTEAARGVTAPRKRRDIPFQRVQSPASADRGFSARPKTFSPRVRAALGGAGRRHPNAAHDTANRY